ncbi:MAG: N-6 DNA methylase [Phycisphaerae bacterium]|nr:N-6 DNA methylase [Phycisphaerae bacterium]
MDRDRFSGRTPVRQCWDYLCDSPETPWGIVCNYVSFRLYHRDSTLQNYELFTLQELRDSRRFAEFLVLFHRDGLLRQILGAQPRAMGLLKQSRDRQKQVGKDLYKDYAQNRFALVGHLRNPPFNKSIDEAIAAAQTLLDRIIFIAFCQNRGLLPLKLIDTVWNLQSFALVTNPRWRNFLDLFRSIDRGNEQVGIPRFNGGLFAENPAVDGLQLDDYWTGFFRALGSYDFYAEITVDVLGHIFEQSITDLEAIRRNPAILSEPDAGAVGKRKREGVYYTPPHITAYIVESTLGPCIKERFAEIAQRYKVDPDAEPTAGGLTAWVDCHNAMLDSLGALRVCDMACGSGAFLVEAYNYLEDIYLGLIHSLCRHANGDQRRMIDDARRTILSENIFGVDLSSEAVEIARLSLWLRSAEKGKTLADLSQNIQCGNSLVDDRKVDPRAMDWESRFAQVSCEGGFDCIISNPPYVKLQNFRKASPEVATFLVSRYRSAKTGNFDMYLPFIERGLELLKPAGRMGFIAPNVWLFNAYGQGLRDLILEKKSLEKFVDFKSFQVFDDATTYTAMQFFSHAPRMAIETVEAPDGDPTNHAALSVPYSRLSNGAWALLPDAGHAILEQMHAKSVRLASASASIFQGLVTSADDVYHLQKLGPGKYFSRACQRVVELEDEIMRPLVSGEAVSAFAKPQTDTYLLFPYLTSESRLYTPKEMSDAFARAWRYLTSNQELLRGREDGKMDHEKWYGYVYPKNIPQQNQAKLLVPRLLLHITASSDPAGEFSPDNVDVGGVIPADGWDLYYLLGILNSRACNFAWRLTARPFRGDYRSANKQFIAPLPVPNVGPKEQKPVAAIARRLADLHSERLAAASKVHRRIVVDLAPAKLVETSPLPPTLSRKLQGFAELPLTDALTELEKFADRRFKPAEREQWDNYLTVQVNAMAKLTRDISDLTEDMNRRVCVLYGLSQTQREAIEADTRERPTP